LPKLICDTSPVQYLHQLGLLHILPALAECVMLPPAVIAEVATGRVLGVNLPDLGALDWVISQRPISERALPLIVSFGSKMARINAARRARSCCAYYNPLNGSMPMSW